MADEEHDPAVEEPYIFTTLRYDPRLLESAENTAASCNVPCPIYMLEHHYTRLQVAKWSTSVYQGKELRSTSGGPSYFLQGLLNAVKQWYSRNPNERPEGLRIKLRNYVSGRITTEIWPTSSLPMSALFPKSLTPPVDPNDLAWSVFLDTEATAPDETTMFKTSDRRSYGRARAAAGITAMTMPQEVLLFTPDGCVIDASISTPYFHRNGRWVTPAASCGGQQGTTRRWALEQGLCEEDSVTVASLRDGEIVCLSNAVRGFRHATFIANNPAVKEPDRMTSEKIARAIC